MNTQAMLQQSADAFADFDGLHRRERNMRSYINGSWNILASMPRDLAVVEPVISYDYQHDLARRKARLKRPMEWRTTPRDHRVAARKRADVYEEYASGSLERCGFSAGGPLLDELIHKVSSSVAACGITEWSDWRPPLRMPGEKASEYNERCDLSMEEFYRFRVVYDPVDACAWMMFRDIITASYRRLRIPFIEFLRQSEHQKLKDEEMMPAEEARLLAEVAGRKFPMVALGQPESEYSQLPSGLAQAIDIMICDDNREIGIFVQGINRNGRPDNQWHEAMCFPNILGRNSMDICTGFELPDHPTTYRYNPTDLALLRNYRTRDSLMTLRVSLLHASLKGNVVQMGDAAAAAWLQVDPGIRREITEALHMPGEGEVLMALGELTSIVDPKTIEILDAVIERVEINIQRQRPDAAVNAAGDEGYASTTPVTTILADLQREDEGNATALENIAKHLVNIQHGIDHACAYEPNPWLNPRSKKENHHDYRVVHITSGNETPYKRTVDPGTRLELKPTDIIFPKTDELKYTSIDERAKAVRRQNAFALRFPPKGPPLIDDDQFLEECGYPNPVEQKKRINKTQLFQLKMPGELEDLNNRLQAFKEVRLGMKPLTLMRPQVQADPVVDAAAAGGPGASPGPTGGAGLTVNAPHIPQPQVTAGATA